MIQVKKAIVGTEARRVPYTKPKLVRLGEVRSLTMGFSGGSGDGVSNMQPKADDMFLPLDN